jgi:hypothetical protein
MSFSTKTKTLEMSYKKDVAVTDLKYIINRCALL